MPASAYVIWYFAFHCLVAIVWMLGTKLADPAFFKRLPATRWLFWPLYPIGIVTMTALLLLLEYTTPKSTT